MELYTQKLKVTKVLWEFSSPGWIKVNTDGASRENSRRSSIGFALTDEEGDIRFACGKVIHDTTNNEEEALAILEALKYYEGQGYIHIMMQTNSLLLKNAIEGSWAVPWAIVEHIEEIASIMERCNVKFSHIMREGNCLADHLANYALDMGDIGAHYFSKLDSQGRRIVNNENLQCPYLRVKVARD
ncbi:uncharacterized protein LOC142175239 [Nicotiana tabacum]|uniref:Uncharacterized protein LOC142175239 n=1 Tax=Nicotiana tabacum TaxID=4097 RepID=A0AC58TL24_TOBAC